MRYMDTDHEWERFGQLDPYWAVVTQDRFRKENLTEKTLHDFFGWGESHIAWVFETVRARLDAGFAPRTALDFGCGVGRLLLPLAVRCASVVGVDVADSMLRKAQSHCDAAGLKNVRLVKGDDALSGVAGPFDLVNSHIVLQHIPCARGRRLFRRLVELVSDDGGVGVLHVGYSNVHVTAPEQSADPPAPPTPDGIRNHLAGLRRAVRRRLARTFARTAPPAAPPAPEEREPQMLMNHYLLNPLFHVLQTAGVRRLHVEFADHLGEYGVVLFFRKHAGEDYQV